MVNDVPYNLVPVWEELISIYDIFKRICSKHGLRHWVVYGTLIGAVRHKGFIPWDDDFDVAMPRPDFEKFQQIVQDELPKGYGWNSFHTDADYCHTFGKIVNLQDETLAKVIQASKLKMSQGIFIDIFPFDGFPSSKVGALVWYTIRAWLRRHASISSMDRFLMLYNYEKSKYICNGNSAWGVNHKMKMIKRRCWVDDLCEVPFANTTVMIPKEFDAYLRCEFGDYTQLPPLEQRKPSHQIME